MQSKKNNIFSVKGVDLKNAKYNTKGHSIPGVGNIKEHIVCLRPGHKTGLPQVYAELKNNKFISHDYGHSGVGYSIMFGTIDQSIQNMKNLKKDFETNKDLEITVVGLGCIGLYTALKLNDLGYKKIKLVGEKYDNTPSHNAGGLFEFSLNTIYKKENIKYLNDIFTASFIEYKKIVEKKHEILSEGVKFVDYFTDFYEEGSGLSYLSNNNYIPQMEKVKLNLSDNKNNLLDLFHFKTFHIIPSKFMDHMLDIIKIKNIPIEFKKIFSFEEISSVIIFNCTGLGSKALNKDIGVYPVCGHGFVFEDKNYGDYDYILRLGEVPGLKDDPIGGSLYFMPKTSGFIGGTYLKDYDGKDDEYNKSQITNLIERAKFLYHGIMSEKRNVMLPKF